MSSMNLLSMFWGKKSLQFIFERLYKLSLKGMNYGRASDYAHNGEGFAIELISRMINSREAILFDVGANKGEFTKQLAEVWSGRPHRVYAFEPSGKTFEMLRNFVKESAAIKLFNLGLGEEPGRVELYYDRAGSGLASVYQRDISYHNISFSDHETIEVTTLDLFCSQQGISSIDFLKLDVEGHELAVLKGGSGMFAAGKVHIVQFEFGGCNIDSRTYFRDYFNFFKKDFDLYRILADGLSPIKAYSEKAEVFQSANYLAVLRKN